MEEYHKYYLKIGALGLVFIFFGGVSGFVALVLAAIMFYIFNAAFVDDITFENDSAGRINPAENREE